MPAYTICRRTARPLAEVVRPVHALHEFGGDDLAGLRILRERGQHLGAPHPLLEHLRRRLHEIVLGADAAGPDPAVVAGEHVVQQVAELVEERVDVVVLAQPGIARLAAGEVADQRRLRDLAALDAGADVELRGMVVLVVARVHVEVEAAGELAAIVEFVALDRRIPHRRILHAAELDAEQLGGDVEHALLDLVVRQVRAQLLRVERVVALAHLLGVVGGLPEVHGRGARSVLLLARQQLRVLASLAAPDAVTTRSMNARAVAALPVILSAMTQSA
jgi:hypothetical protein